MNLEAEGQNETAGKIFLQAWNEATNDFEKFIAAHYVARHQVSITDKLKWDNTALKLALNIDSGTVRASLSSLYLNIAKCYEDLMDYENAKMNYELASNYSAFLPDNGYGNLIKGGIMKGLERVTNLNKSS